MTRVLAVAARELRERWLLLPASLVLGFNPLVFPAFGVDKQAVLLLGLTTVLLLGGAAAVVMGSTMLARDTATGRLGFLFARPVRWLEIWGGKWLASVVLVTVTGFLAAIPWMAVYPPETYGGSWLRALLDAQNTALFSTLVLLAVGLANFGATAFRSRSAWLVIDLLLSLASLWAVRRYLAPLFLFGLLEPRGWGYALVLTPLALALLLGSAAQVARGRTDIRRAHHALSIVCWTVIATALACAAGWLAHIRAAGPADLSDPYGRYQIMPDPNGRWVYLQARTNRGGNYFPGFLLDSSGSGRYLAVNDFMDWPWWRIASFSSDGRFAALWAESPDGRATDLVRVALDANAERLTRVTLESSPPPTWNSIVALSPAGTTALLVHESGMSLFSLPSGRRVATTALTPGWHAAAVRFLGEDAVRAWLIPSPGRTGAVAAPREIHVVDLARGAQPRTAAFTLDQPLRRPGAIDLRVDRNGQRLLTLDGGLHLRDAATGTLKATPLDGAAVKEACFLADGRVVALESAAGSTLLHVFAPDGTAGVTARLAQPRAWLGPEIATGRIAVGFGSSFAVGGTLIVDAADGRVVQQLDGLHPVNLPTWHGDFSTPPETRQSFPPSFFADERGRLVRLDASTGERRVVAGPGAPRGERLRSN